MTRIFQVFDTQENTYYVEARTSEEALQYVAESFQTTVHDWCEIPFTPVNTTIHVASYMNPLYDRKNSKAQYV